MEIFRLISGFSFQKFFFFLFSPEQDGHCNYLIVMICWKILMRIGDIIPDEKHLGHGNRIGKPTERNESFAAHVFLDKS